MIDISTDGCRVEIVASLSARSWVWLSLPDLETQYARVAWSFDTFAGLEFASALSVAVVRRLVSVDMGPSERRAAQLQELSARCRVLAGRQSAAEYASRLLTLSRDCEARAVVEELRNRFG